MAGIARGTPAAGTAHAYEEVRRLIVDGALQPGDRLTVRVLGERLGLSATPVKSALAALARDGLVTSEANRGCFVTVLDEQDVRELFELREALEPYAARLGVSAGTSQETLADLRELVSAQRVALAEDDRAGYNDLNLQFHRRLWRLGGNRRLNQLMDNVVGQMSLVTTFTSRAPGRVEHAIEEHATLVQLCADGEGQRLGELVAAHVRASYAAYRQMVTWSG